MSQGKSPQTDGVLSWVGLGVAVFGIIFSLIWLVDSSRIVYYCTPVFDFLAFPWRLIPTAHARQVAADLDFNYSLFRRHSAFIPLRDWLDYINVVLRPWAICFGLIAIFLFMRQLRKLNAERLNKKMTPKGLALHMMHVFSDIAPVVEIQEKLVANTLPRWARQVFPEEFLRRLRYQRQSVLVPGESGELEVDVNRLRQALSQTRPYVHEGLKLRESPYLGRQLVDVRHDAGHSNDALFMERLSPAGKAVMAILAPYAFNAAKGKVVSEAVKDALNYSAYGSPQGMANLSLPLVAETFGTWKAHPLIRKLAKIHQWEITFLMALLEHAQRSGKIGPWQFIWLKPTHRVMFYALNQVGRKTPHSESGIAFSQLQYERKAARMGMLPLIPDGPEKGQLAIFTPRVSDALQEEWHFWVNGEDENEDWWQDETLLDWDKNEAFIAAMRELNAAPTVPDDAQ